MLDKSVPYFDLIMRRPAGALVPATPLPPGYSLIAFHPGGEQAWAEIEAAVLEFDSAAEARAYFTANYSAWQDEANRRVFFVQAADGELVGTTSVWWEYTGRRRVPALHWVGVKPEFQGKGIGKAMVSSALQAGLAIEGDVDFYLHTQTWSYRAIGIYLQTGFRLLPTETYADHQNSYQQALPHLHSKLSPQALALL